MEARSCMVGKDVGKSTRFEGGQGPKDNNESEKSHHQSYLIVRKKWARGIDRGEEEYQDLGEARTSKQDYSQ